METELPQAIGYKGMFLVGNRKQPAVPTITERTGTVVVKRTYDVDVVAGVVRPSARPLPVFVKDVPDNLLLNSNFESDLLDADGNAIDWQPESVSISPFFEFPVPPSGPNEVMRVTGNANGRVVQTVVFDEPVGGREFTLSVRIAADAAAQVSGVRLEADDHELCSITGNVPVFPGTVFSASGVWPGDVTATEVKVVLRMATNSSRTVYYDNVQLEERGYRTRWDPNTVFRYENDLAAFKPEGDLVVIGFAGSAGNYDIKVNGSTWLSRSLSLSTGRKKAVMGWEATLTGPRNVETGTFPAAPTAYPLDDPLPPDFKNHYFNGHRRTRADPDADEVITANEPFAYIPSAAHVTVERNNVPAYALRLRGDTVTARYSYYSGTGEDEETQWTNVNVPMWADTIVVEPESHRCYVVWRGSWSFDDHTEDAYRKLVVEGSE